MPLPRPLPTDALRGWARCSDASDRPSILRQDSATHSLCDCASYSCPARPPDDAAQSPADDCGDADAAWLSRANAALPPDIRIFGRLRTRRGFHGHQACERRSYGYLLPLPALGGAFAEPRLSGEETAATLRLFGVGSHHWEVRCGGRPQIEPPLRGPRADVGWRSRRGEDRRRGEGEGGHVDRP